MYTNVHLFMQILKPNFYVFCGFSSLKVWEVNCLLMLNVKCIF